METIAQGIGTASILSALGFLILGGIFKEYRLVLVASFFLFVHLLSALYLLIH